MENFMPDAESYTKHIACLESLWNDDIEERWNVFPLLKLVGNIHDLRVAHLTCNTEPEFAFNLDLLSKKRNFGILYMAFHGGPGEIYLADETAVTLELLAEYMKKRFKGWVIHFGSCGTLAVEDEQIAQFIEQTGVNMVLGYDYSVDWIESAAMDILLFQSLQNYVDLRAFWRHMTHTYPDLIAKTGLEAHFG